MEPDAAQGVERQIAELRARVQWLEETLRRDGIGQQGSHAGAADFVERKVSAPALAQEGSPAAEPASTIGASAPHARERSLENVIGSLWAERIGILAMLIGMAWFLKFASDNHWIGALTRVLIGLAAGAGIIGWSERFQRKGYAGFGYSLKAVGSGILYLSLWAAFSLFHLVPAPLGFAGMVAVTAFNGWMAWRQDAELLAFYSIVGGLSTPLLLANGENHQASLFSYLLLFDLAVVTLAALRPWSRLLFAAFAGTAAYMVGWWFDYYSDAQFGSTASFLTAFFLLFAFAPLLARTGRTGEKARWQALAFVVLPLMNAGLAFVGFYSMLEAAQMKSSEPLMAIAFAGFYFLLLKLPGRGLLHGGPDLLKELHLATAVVLLAIAVPLRLHGRWLTIGWLVEGGVLLWVASHGRALLLRGLALLCLGLGLVTLVILHPAASLTPILNQRFGTYCVGIAVFALAAWIAGRPEFKAEPQGIPWRNIAAGSLLVMNGLILLAVGWEIHSYWWLLHWNGRLNLVREYRMYAQFSYSAFFMLFGAILLGAGFLRRSAFVRWQALILIAFAIGKVFLADVSTLREGYRIMSFLGLGGLLLTISFVYQRDWLRLRTKSPIS